MHFSQGDNRSSDLYIAHKTIHNFHNDTFIFSTKIFLLQNSSNWHILCTQSIHIQINFRIFLEYIITIKFLLWME